MLGVEGPYRAASYRAVKNDQKISSETKHKGGEGIDPPSKEGIEGRKRSGLGARSKSRTFDLQNKNHRLWNTSHTRGGGKLLSWRQGQPKKP